MILLALISTACGSLLGRSFKAFVLIPASLLVWISALAFAWSQGFSPFEGLAAAVSLGACLQLGYLAAAAVMDFRTQRHGRRVAATS